MLPVRALRLPAAPAPGLRMDVGPGAADLGRDTGVPRFLPLDTPTARKEPPPRDRQSAVPDPAMGAVEEPGLAHPLGGLAPAAAGLARPVQGDASAHRDPALPARSTRRRAGPMSEPPRNAADTTDTPNGISPRRTSGSDPCGRTGGARSIGEVIVLRQPLRHSVTR